MSEAGLPVVKDIVVPLAEDTKKAGSALVEGLVKLDHTPVDTNGAPTTIDKALAGANAAMRDPDCNATPAHDRHQGFHKTTNVLKDVKEAVVDLVHPVLPEKKKTDDDEKKEDDPSDAQ